MGLYFATPAVMETIATPIAAPASMEICDDALIEVMSFLYVEEMCKYSRLAHQFGMASRVLIDGLTHASLAPGPGRVVDTVRFLYENCRHLQRLRIEPRLEEALVDSVTKRPVLCALCSVLALFSV